MDEIVAEFIRRTLLKIPAVDILKILKIWNFLPESQLETIKLHQCKESLSQDVVELCQKKRTSMKEAAILDIIYHQTCPNRKIWTVYEMTKFPGEEVDLSDMEEFKDSFKKILQRNLRNVHVSFRDSEDNAVWIRIAWGTPHMKPNQYKTTYVVYHSQTPFVFICHCRIKRYIPELCQALMTAGSYHKIRQMELRSLYLDSLKAIVFKQYNQDFEICYLTPLQKRNFETEIVDPRIIHENIKEKERIQRVTQETFGDCVQPRLEFAQYKKIQERSQPFHSPHLNPKEEI
ncbi:centromere protein N isoform X3 [Monodelphis domestica]|uniref:centromere protein N isoform X3 n=1 Tax=Monodelphis domestica TaxID=13616 RepID=UPI0024E1FA2E|nr:centromere protein N isoform X3 [Monodelphis domestica]XP_056669270.1 centromere protein N isoform X3 [Monodelphis domestica]